MMTYQFGIVTLFPEAFSIIKDYGVIGRAVKQGLVDIICCSPRDWTYDTHQTVDDRPYGGGPGMVMKAEPLDLAVNAMKMQLKSPAVIHLSAKGKPLRHESVIALAEKSSLILVASRYAGVDERFIERCVDEEYSIGDYVLSGGELPAMVLIDAISRQLPGVLGNDDSAGSDSFAQGLLGYPSYTRPEIYQGTSVPRVLLTGNHKAVDAWRLQKAIEKTKSVRPDLWVRYKEKIKL